MRNRVPTRALYFVEQRMNLAVHIPTAQRDCVIEQSHYFDEFGRQKPNTPAIIGFPEQRRCYFDTPFGEKYDAKPVPRIANISPVTSEHRTKLRPKPLTYFEPSPPGWEFLITVCVMVWRNFSRFYHVVCYEVAGVRTDTTPRSYSILEEGKFAAYEVAEILRNDRLRPKHSFVGGSLLVIPKVIFFSYRIPSGPVDHAV